MSQHENIGTVGVLFTDSAKWYKDNRPFKKPKNRSAYSLFARKGKEHGLEVVFAHHKEYRQDGSIRRGWCYDKRWHKVTNKRLDFIYVRFNAAAFRNNKKVNSIEKLKYSMIKNTRVINHPILEDFCWDKRIVAELFPEHCPKTFVINTVSGLKTVVSEIKSKKIVIKPRFGTLGEDVKIVDRDDLPKKVNKNTLVQEFIDTSYGIKGITDKVHDLRTIIVNGKIDHCHVRTPKKGFLANMSLGGEKTFVHKDLLPIQVHKIIKKVDHVLDDYNPRIYSIDFMFDKKGKPYIVECNSSPVITRYAYGKYKRPEFYDSMFNAMISSRKAKVIKNLGTI